jgi:hypothetical protein
MAIPFRCCSLTHGALKLPEFAHDAQETGSKSQIFPPSARQGSDLIEAHLFILVFQRNLAVDAVWS